MDVFDRSIAVNLRAAILGMPFLLSPAASFITGVALPVDGGVTANTGQALLAPD